MADYAGATHVSAAERAAVAALRDWGLVDAYRLHHPEPGKFSWWDYRAGNFHKGLGMRIDHLYVTRSVAGVARPLLLGQGHQLLGGCRTGLVSGS